VEGAARHHGQRAQLAHPRRRDGGGARASVIFGARTVEQLDDNLKAAELKLPAAAMQKLDEASAFDLGSPYEFIKHIQGRW
jgi:aryl-alcohol dehydrogenase-like predicted oxidoreductase